MVSARHRPTLRIASGSGTTHPNTWTGAHARQAAHRSRAARTIGIRKKPRGKKRVSRLFAKKKKTGKKTGKKGAKQTPSATAVKFWRAKILEAGYHEDEVPRTRDDLRNLVEEHRQGRAVGNEGLRIDAKDITAAGIAAKQLIKEFRADEAVIQQTAQLMAKIVKHGYRKLVDTGNLRDLGELEFQEYVQEAFNDLTSG